MRFAVQFRALVEVEADNSEHAIERARIVVEEIPTMLHPVGVLKDPRHHGERQPEPGPLPPVHRAHYRDSARPQARDRRGG